jgi:splicing factor 3B subunit 3
MHLYNVTLQSTTAITRSIVGNFSGSKTQEILLAKNQILELLSIDPTTGLILSLLSFNVFGIIRDISTFRLLGSLKGFGC